MIIKVIPENDQERRMVQDVEHIRVKEFFMFGTKKDKDGDLLDFHDWHGSYRFLIGSLAYFSDVISSERSRKESSDDSIKSIPRVLPAPPAMIKYGSEMNNNDDDNGVVNGVIADDMQDDAEELIDQPNAMDEESPTPIMRPLKGDFES